MLDKIQLEKLNEIFHREIKPTLEKYSELMNGGYLMENEVITKEELFRSWTSELGYTKAVLLSCNYPILQVVRMSDEEAESELEAIRA